MRALDEQENLFAELEYKAFTEKFKPKKTTDDCYTPPELYEAIKGWVCRRYNRSPADIVRPFYPGGDYEHFEYPENCFVLDNPPFSILAQIQAFYLDRDIKFFLFAPTLTCLGGKSALEINHIVCYADIVYENGAVVPTSFVTNLADDGVVLSTAPELNAIIQEYRIKANSAKELPKYEYPLNVMTVPHCLHYARRGIKYSLRKEDCFFIRALDAQKSQKKSIFGAGLLLSDKAAADKAAADKAAADKAAADKAAADKVNVTVWKLSERELFLITKLNDKRKKQN